MYYTVIKHNRHLRTQAKCRKHEPQVSVFYIFEVFSNVRSVLSQCNTRFRLLIAVFNIKRTLKFKPQPTVYVFHCRQSSKRTSRETEAHFSWVKRSRSILFFSVFKGLLAVAIILIDGREKANRQLGFELQSSHVIEKHNNLLYGIEMIWWKTIKHAYSMFYTLIKNGFLTNHAGCYISIL